MPHTKSVAESPSAKKSKATPVPLSEEEINVLRSHLDEWNRNKGKARRRIRDAAIAEARFIAPKMDKKMLKLRRNVSVCHQQPVLWKADWVDLQVYTTWFFNHGGRKRSQADKYKWGKRWTARSVIKHQKRDEIVELTGGKAGDKEMIGNYQAALNTIMQGLTDEERQQAEDTAEDWTNKAPPADVQAKFAEKKADAVTKSFASYMWKQGGIRIFVMSAWQTEGGEVRLNG